MVRYIKLLGWLMVQQIKVSLEYPLDFIINILSQIVIQSAGLLAIGVVMANVPSLSGWKFDEVVLIYGLLTLCFGIYSLFSYELWPFWYFYIRQGRLDTILIRPLDPLLQLIAGRLGIQALGDLLLGAVLVIRSMLALDVSWSPFQVVYLLVAVLSGATIFYALTLISVVPAFRMIPTFPITWAIFKNFEFAKYPLHIFPRAIIFLVTWIIPYGFASYYPAGTLLGRDTGMPVWAGPLVAASLMTIAILVWRSELRQYSSSGS